MGGDPIPGPHDWMVEWFEAWKARTVVLSPTKPTNHHQPNW